MGVSRLIQSGDTIEPNEFEFTYTGNYNFKDGAGGTIELEFLTSGTFTLLKSTPFKPFDLCLVGGGGAGGKGYAFTDYPAGGGAGGGGGYVENVFDVPIELNKAYSLVIGGSNGDTTGFGYTAKAGVAGAAGASSGASGSRAGGAGGSGGGANCYDGGSNGSDGLGSAGGRGQRITTKAFCSGKLFSGGGGGGYSYNMKAGAGGAGGGGAGGAKGSAGSKGVNNTGGGGGGGSEGDKAGGAGGSGIIILRRRWDSNFSIINNYITNNITTTTTTA